LSLRQNFEFGLLRNAETVETLGTLGERLNALWIFQMDLKIWGSEEGRMLWFGYEMSSPKGSCVKDLVSSWWHYEEVIGSRDL
jgi:hypothetical protein